MLEVVECYISQMSTEVALLLRWTVIGEWCSSRDGLRSGNTHMIDNTFVCACAHRSHTIACTYPNEELDRNPKFGGTEHNSHDGHVPWCHFITTQHREGFGAKRGNVVHRVIPPDVSSIGMTIAKSCYAAHVINQFAYVWLHLQPKLKLVPASSYIDQIDQLFQHLAPQS